ncbi:MAG: RIP metalloprotease RseP [Gemmatimonadetes bacterium]|nr:RIP metalloprotease RseP [Gemmatimonadota bacterium]
MGDLIAPTLSFVENALVFILSLGLMIFIHELGHFAVAKWCDVRVLTFSIGMGRKLLRFQPGETEYAISAIPFGGYVKMSGETPEDPAGGDGRDFASKGLPARSAIVLAGPAMNVVLALVVHYFLSLAVGIGGPREIGIETVREGSAAFEAGLRVGDRIAEIDGVEIGSPLDVVDAVRATPAGESIVLAIEREDEELALRIAPRFDEELGVPLLGIRTQVIQEPIVGQVKRGGIAEAAGLREGDRLTAIAGAPIDDWLGVQMALSDRIGSEISIAAIREGETIEFRIVPETSNLAPQRPDGSPLADVGMIAKQPMQPVSWIGAAGAALAATWRDSVYLFESLRQILSFRVSRESVAGPVGIATVIAESYAYGIDRLFRLVALISVNLAVINLFPFPVLDGGQLVFFTIEAVLRRPMSDRVMMISNQIGVVVLLLLFVFLTLNDIDRIIPVSIFGG